MERERGGRGGRGGFRGGRGGYQGEREDRPFSGERGGRGGGRGGRGGGRGGRGGFGGGSGEPLVENGHVKLKTNMFKVSYNSKNLLKIREYHVDIFDHEFKDVTKMSKGACRKVIMALSNKLKNNLLAYDGGSTLFVTKEIDTKLFFDPLTKPIIPGAAAEPKPQGGGKKKKKSKAKAGETEPAVESLSTGVQEMTLSSRCSNKFDQTANHVHIILGAEEGKSPKDFVVQLKSVQLAENKLHQLLQIFGQWDVYKRGNVILRGRSLYFTDEQHTETLLDTSDLDLLRGIFQSFRYTELGAVLNVDVTQTLAIAPMPLHNWLALRLGNMRVRRFADLHDRQLSTINKDLRGLKVKCGVSKIGYVLEGLEKGGLAHQVKFTKDDKTYTVAQYFKERYNTDLPKDEVVLVPKKRIKGNKIYLPASKLTFVEGQNRRSQLSSEERDALLDATRQDPRQRLQKVNEALSEVLKSSCWKDLNVSISTESISISAAVLPTPQLKFGNSNITPEKGAWNLRGLTLIQSPSREVSWTVVSSVRIDGEKLDGFVSNMTKISGASGLKLGRKPTMVSAASDDEFVRAVEAAKTDVVFTILPDKNALRYHRIKEAALRKGVVSQCAQEKTKIETPAVCGNLAAALNSKLGHINSVVDPATVDALIGKGVETCVVGIDVYHGHAVSDVTSSGSGSSDFRSVVAMCTSLDKSFTQYHTQMALQSGRKEVVENVKELFIQGLKAYHGTNKKLPHHIVVYRDGVGEGMYDLVSTQEVEMIHAAAKEVYKNKTPEVTYIVVQKRNHLRTFNENGSGQVCNPPPGTFIHDRMVVDMGTENFYMYSHQAIIGTARPTHYQVLFNPRKISTENLARFTYGMAHLHQGCTRAVSIPAAVVFADKACDIVGHILDIVPEFRFQFPKDSDKRLWMI